MPWINGQFIPINRAGTGQLIPGRSPLSVADWFAHPFRSAADYLSGPPTTGQETPPDPLPFNRPAPPVDPTIHDALGNARVGQLMGRYLPKMAPPPPVGPADFVQSAPAAPAAPMVPPPVPPLPGVANPAPQRAALDVASAPPDGLGRIDRLISQIAPNESAGDPNAKNPSSSASGLLQVTDGTWANFLKSTANINPATGMPFGPGDKNLPLAQRVLAKNYLSNADKMLSAALGRPATDGEVLSSWMLGPAGVKALAQADPNANAMQVYASVAGPDVAKRAFSQNGKLLTRDMTVAQALASAAAHFGAAGGTPGTPGDGVTPDASTTAVVGGADPTSPDRLRYLQEAQKFIPHPSTTDMGLALASGLLGGPSLGQGLSKGLQNVLGLRAQDRKADLQALNYAGSMSYKDAVLGLRGRSADIQQQRANQGDARVKVLQDKLSEATGPYGEANPTANATMKATVAQLPKWNEAVQQTQANEKLIGEIKDGLAAGQGFSTPDIQTKLKAWLSMALGVKVDQVTPDGVFVGGKLLNTAAMQQMAANAQGKSMRIAILAQKDAASALSQGMTPSAINTILDLQHADNQRILETNAQLQAAMKDPTTFRHLMIDNGGLSNYVGKLQTKYYAERQGVAPGTLPSGHIVPNADGSGLKYQTYDKNSGIGFTVHP